MKKNNYFLTLRNVEFWQSYQIIYEWEDEMCKYLGYKLQNIYPDKKCYKISSIWGLLFFLYKKYIRRQSKNVSFYFEMVPKLTIRKFSGLIKLNFNIHNNSSSIPIFIDFFLKREQLNDLYKTYNKVPFLFITSAEAYSFLVKNNCPLKIYHLPLSLPDKYKLDKNVSYKKIYNLVLIGRSNIFLLDCLNEYCDRHPDFIYLSQRKVNDVLYYVTNKGEIVGQFHSRESYIELIRSTKIALYSTPGIDTIDHRTNGFNQVTPRLFELMAAQCLILARYPDNEDTRYYELNKIIPSINSYSEFESKLNVYLETTTCPLNEYSTFLSKHYTSERCNQLIDIIKNK